MKTKKLIFIFSAIVLLSVAVWIISCAVNPVTGKKEFMLLTESDEIALGQQTDQQVIQTYGIYDDPELTAYIDRLGQNMSKITHRSNLKYTFKVLDTPVVNAFAVPGGYVYFTRGILGYLNNEAELAGVMGHELGHVNARHSAVQYSRAQLAQLGLGVGMIFSERFREYAGLAQFGVSMLFLRFSRDNERQADDLGVEYSTKTGYDSHAMATFFETLERMHPSSGASGLPEWFSTHPNPVDRIGAVNRKTDEWQKQVTGENFVLKRNEYLTEVDGITFGEDPRQGYVEGNAFYHPEMKFTFPVPSEWQVNNTPAQVQVVSQKQDAAILFALDNASTPQQASVNFTTNAGARVSSSDAVTVNGMKAQRVYSVVQSEQQRLRVVSYFIEKEGKVFAFHGFADSTGFSNYQQSFVNTMSHFNKLTDPNKINVKPAQLSVKNVTKAGTLRSVLTAYGVPSDKLEEMAILNGKKLDDNIAVNTKIKVVVK
ncbi:M48 family metalloprotease [candidate division KSB1 bacterium]|nr:M48 family metalloprotease [candidate division KSB1 bacterium]